MLKVALKQVENIVIGKIIEQGDEIKRGNFNFIATNGFTICSKAFPAINNNFLWIQGEETENDHICFTYSSETKAEAEGIIIYICDAVREYNNSLLKTNTNDNNLFCETNCFMAK